ncbi:unnamed protein product, partial [marine sediment metagenome]
GINVDNYGIVAGTGDTAVENDDYKLETQLTEGAGAGDITHGAVIVGSAALVDSNVDIVHYRPFTNNTGSTIAVKETGIYTSQNLLVSRDHCIIRDVLGAPIDVPDKCSLTVYYTIRTTVTV